MQVKSIVNEALARLQDFRVPDTQTLTLPYLTPTAAARLIDHTLLKPEATARQIRTLCMEAIEWGFASVCVNPTWAAYCYELLAHREVAGPEVAVCAVVGFPLGASMRNVKAYETAAVVAAGAGEVDMVINIGALRDGDYAFVYSDIRAVVEMATEGDSRVKVILETCLLSAEEKAIACRLALEAGAAFVKTSTGFNAAGATVEDVALMRHMVGEEAGVKAAGGVRSAEDFRRMVAAGATRIGTSGGVSLLAGLSPAGMAEVASMREDY